MNVLTKQTEIKVPNTYQEWLCCFEIIKDCPFNCNEVLEAVSCGNFVGTETMNAAIQKQLVDTISVVLDKVIKRFTKELNQSLSFNDLSQVDVLFRRFKRTCESLLFFENLFFLPEEFRKELSLSIKKQVRRFWDDTIDFLREKSLEISGYELEDALFLIKRIYLF